MTTTPAFAATPRCSTAQISTANTARDGTGTLGTLFTAPANGTRIDRIEVKATGTTTAGMVRLFINDGTNTRLWKEVPVTAITPSGTVTAFAATLDLSARPELLPSGYSIKAGTNNAETFNVKATGGDF